MVRDQAVAVAARRGRGPVHPGHHLAGRAAARLRAGPAAPRRSYLIGLLVVAHLPRSAAPGRATRPTARSTTIITPRFFTTSARRLHRRRDRPCSCCRKATVRSRRSTRCTGRLRAGMRFNLVGGYGVFDMNGKSTYIAPLPTVATTLMAVATSGSAPSAAEIAPRRRHRAAEHDPVHRHHQPGRRTPISSRRRPPRSPAARRGRCPTSCCAKSRPDEGRLRRHAAARPADRNRPLRRPARRATCRPPPRPPTSNSNWSRPRSPCAATACSNTHCRRASTIRSRGVPARALARELGSTASSRRSNGCAAGPTSFTAPTSCCRRCATRPESSPSTTCPILRYPRDGQRRLAALPGRWCRAASPGPGSSAR